MSGRASLSDVRWDGARVTVLGLGRSGEAAARALLERGAHVTVLDAGDGAAQRERAARIPEASLVLGREEPSDLAGTDVVIASPGVAPFSSWIAAARAGGLPLWSEVELAYRLGLRPAVAITGTNGKTTTTEMTAAALRAAGWAVATAGNIGTPLIAAPADRTIVAELSSFQLWGIESFRARIGVLLNVAEDHLDWHGSFAVYAAAKARIFENQLPADTAIVHADSVCGSLAAGTRAAVVPFSEVDMPAGGAGLDDGWIIVPRGRVVEVDRLRVRGRPNRADAVAAAAAACALGADLRAVGRGLVAYEPKPHRVETVAVVDGVTYVNDSKATSPHATMAALEEMAGVVLIAGGRNKGLDLSVLTEAAPRLRAVIAVGEAAGEVEKAFRDTGVPVGRAESMEWAVIAARALAQPGDTVLLSPACASFDMFAGYESRGEAFRAAVMALEGRAR